MAGVVGHGARANQPTALRLFVISGADRLLNMLTAPLGTVSGKQPTLRSLLDAAFIWLDEVDRAVERTQATMCREQRAQDITRIGGQSPPWSRHVASPVGDRWRPDVGQVLATAHARMVNALEGGWTTDGVAKRREATILIAGLLAPLVAYVANASVTAAVLAVRASQRDYMEANADVVEGWVWISALSPTTCAACWAMHGSVHAITESLDDHVNGQCEMQMFRTGEQPQVPTGETLFAQIDARVQRLVLGAAKFALYSAGLILLSDLVDATRAPDGRATIHEKPLRRVKPRR